jgi:hypothetical protein
LFFVRFSSAYSSNESTTRLAQLLAEEKAEHQQKHQRSWHALDSIEWSAEQEYSRYMAYVASASAFDLMSWWKAHAVQFPALSLLFREFFSCPLTSASTERLASAGGRTITFDRTGLAGSTAADLLFINKNVPLLYSLNMWPEWSAAK